MKENKKAVEPAKEKAMVNKGTIVHYRNIFNGLKSFEGLSGKDMSIILDDMDKLDAIVDPMVEKQSRLYKSLQTEEFTSLQNKAEELKGKNDLTAEDNAVLERFGKMQYHVNERMSALEQEMYNEEIEEPSFGRISKEAFITLCCNNTVRDGKEGGLYVQGFKILRKLIVSQPNK